MRIAVIGTKGLPAMQGGIEHACQELYSRIVSRGHKVDLFARCSYTNAAWFSTTTIQGIRVISLPGLRLKGVDAFSTTALSAILASRNEYDVIHFHALGPALFSCLPKQISRSTVIVTCHGLDWKRAKWGKLSTKILRLGERVAVQSADELIAVSEDIQLYFKEKYNRNSVYIPNAPASYVKADPSFSYGVSLGLTPKRYILFLGRLVPEKRIDLLIQAFKSLNLPDWKLVIAGATSDTNSFVARLNGILDQHPRFVFTGQLHGAKLTEIVQGASLFVLPSDVEGFPLAMLEAMNEEIPVLASNIPVHQQLLANNRGLLFQAGDLKSCTEQLQWALEHLQDMQVKAQNAQVYVKTHYSWEQISEETLGVYQQLSSLKVSATSAI